MRPQRKEIPLQAHQSQPRVQEVGEGQSKFIYYLFEKQFQIISAPRGLILATLGLTVLFAFLCVSTTILALNVKDIQIMYANERQCISTNLVTDNCLVQFSIKQKMEAPIYLLYSVKNIYINHRRFLSSYSLDQIKGLVISEDDAETLCAPIKLNKDIPENISWAGVLLQPDDVASPCGIKAQGYFNDSFFIFQNGQQILIDRNLNATVSAINSHRAPSSQYTQWVDPQQISFKLYMLDDALMTKRRVWGVIHDNLQPGIYDLVVANNFQMVDLRIIKGILLTTSTIIGGKQYWYPVFFGLATLACIIFAIAVKIKFKNYGVLRAFKKKQHPK